MENVETAPRRGPKRGYNWKKWIAIYLAVAAVVYVIVYFVFFHSSGGYGGGGGSGGGGGGYAMIPLPLLALRYAYDRIRRH
jgi:hypothetical protein